jgi:hypothetical protein
VKKPSTWKRKENLKHFTVIYKAPVDKKMPGVCPDLTNDSVMMASKNKGR